MKWLLVIAAVLFALLLFCTRYSYVEGFAAALLPSDPTGPAGLPSDPPEAPNRVDARCKNYGFSMTNIPGPDDSKRYYTQSGCQALGGTWDNSSFTCFTSTINYSQMCSGLPYTTPAPDECFPKGDRTQILGKPNAMLQNKPETIGLYRLHTQDECQRLGGVATELPEQPGSYICTLGTTPLYTACRSLNYRDPVCKNYGASLPPSIAGKNPLRLFTKSGCDGVGGTLTDGGYCNRAEGGNWNTFCAGLDNKTPAPDECFPGGDRSKILGRPNAYEPTQGADWTGNMRLYTRQECDQMGGTITAMGTGANSDVGGCMVNNAALHIACASLNFQPAAPGLPTPTSAAPLSPTVSAALAPGTPSAATGVSCPACASCPPPPPAQCPPSAPCPAPPSCPTCAPPTICPPPPDCPKYDKKKD
jgi:hypothetical protein